MTVSANVLAHLGWQVQAALHASGAQVDVPTRTVYAILTKAGVDIPGTTEQAKWRMLGRLAERGYPGAFQGEPKSVTRWGKTTTVKPWRWKDVPAAKVEAWAAGGGAITPRGTLAADVQELKARVAELEKQVADLAAAVAQ